MPEINIAVKIIGGKRTPLEVYVKPLSENGRTITFQNGAVLSDSSFEAIIDKAIIDYIEKNGTEQLTIW